VSREAVVSWIEENYRLFRSADGLPFAVPTSPGSLRIAKEVRSIRADVLLGYRKHRAEKSKSGRGVIIKSDHMRSIMEVVGAIADASDDVMPVALRAAQVGDDRVVIDLGDATGQVVAITRDGYRVTEQTDDMPLFRRTAATTALPAPERGGSLNTLRELLGLADERHWMLVRGWLVASLFSEYPRPLLWATGPQGSGKSTRARMALSLIEPVESLGKEPGRNERDDSTAARGRFLVSYDNITSVSQNTSDWLCRLVTGVTDDRRALYSDDDLRPVAYKRSGVATSITMPSGLGSDALERIVHVPLDRMPDTARRGEAGLWTAYAAARPAMFGALLDDVALVLRHLGEIRADTSRSWPRMADYAMILAALDRGLGLADDVGHLAAYTGAVDESMSDRALDDPFTAAVLDFVRGRRGVAWRGKSPELLIALDERSGWDWQTNRQPEWWPRSARALTTQLDRASESLRHAGVVIDRERTRDGRYLTLRQVGEIAESGDGPAPSANRDAGLPFEVPFYVAGTVSP
jgi:energy-coupling factor transporter ATP-binding protein EcfA2